MNCSEAQNTVYSETWQKSKLAEYEVFVFFNVLWGISNNVSQINVPSLICIFLGLLIYSTSCLRLMQYLISNKKLLVFFPLALFFLNFI